MAAYFCRHGTQAPSLSAAKYCTGDQCHQSFVEANLTPPPPKEKPTRRVIHVFEPPTPQQLWKVGRIGGDREKAKGLNRGECSRYIDQLLADPPCQEDSPMPSTPSLVPLDLLATIPDGRYAVRADETRPWSFYRVTRPTNGNYAGTLKIQTQHTDWYRMCLSVKDGKINWYRPQRDHESDLLVLISDPQWWAIMYSIELGHCCICGRELTHEDSLKYGIGPECVKSHPEIPERMEQARAEGAVQ